MNFQLSKLEIFKNDLKVMLFLNESQNDHELHSYGFMEKK